MLRFDRSSTLDGINNNTYDTLFNNGPIYLRQETTSEKEFMLKQIELFTLLSAPVENIILKGNNLIKKNRDGYIIKQGKRQYFFYKMDQFVDEETGEILKTGERYGKCCTASMKYAYNSDKECEVVIGHINYSNTKMLHALFVEKYPDGDIVYDYTKNLVMKKEDYFDLTNYEVINVVTGKKIKKDIDYLEAFKYIPTKAYLCFRDEIIRDLKKNKKSLKLGKQV